ncbi:fluoride efflux transporter CrcB [Saccharibacillus sp. CPCC 101409]|uniref:fluoride efflux transporter CrcB n=1 Tax=Saccharibacillus sp. CPCC 101409 TaxID=3058041 RepID=UPI002673F18D|nr:fluoride efflux transporter CrcB [Saccharibacillus sp. CPCC 101409]MDO3409024.1 fluoride efflux transporter CrcB [Saccharibacillus sp. CPCC 101409]
MTLNSILLVALGGAIGAPVRYLLGKWALNALGGRFPWGTWIINISGSLLLGALFAAESRMPGWVYPLLGIGFAGAYTTFSTFGYETVQLLESRRLAAAAVYIVSSALLGLLAAALGAALAG